MVEALVQEGCGESTCNTCLRITCAACGRSKKPTQYRRKDVWNYLKQRTNTRCRACRRRGYRRGCRCTKCGVYQRLSAFRWTTRRGREDICRSCQLVPYAVCAATLSSGNVADSNTRSYFNSAGAKHMTCLVRKGYRCTKCGGYQCLSAFRWTKKRGREDICRSCELVPCAACAAMLSSMSFAASDIRTYFNSAGAKHMQIPRRSTVQHLTSTRSQYRAFSIKMTEACTPSPVFAAYAMRHSEPLVAW